MANKTMLLQEYNKKWMDDFLAIQKLLSSTLVDLHVSIEHIGSTSVPGLAAKPIIDIDIVISEHSTFDVVQTRLTTIGYRHHGNRGIPGREVFKRAATAAVHEVLDGVAHHLYVCAANSEELQKHLLFRNYLLADEEARVQYQSLKYKIAEEADQDRKKYAALKEMKATAFINSIVKKAAKQKTING